MQCAWGSTAADPLSTWLKTPLVRLSHRRYNRVSRAKKVVFSYLRLSCFIKVYCGLLIGSEVAVLRRSQPYFSESKARLLIWQLRFICHPSSLCFECPAALVSCPLYTDSGRDSLETITVSISLLFCLCCPRTDIKF